MVTKMEQDKILEAIEKQISAISKQISDLALTEKTNNNKQNRTIRSLRSAQQAIKSLVNVVIAIGSVFGLLYYFNTTTPLSEQQKDLVNTVITALVGGIGVTSATKIVGGKSSDEDDEED